MDVNERGYSPAAQSEEEMDIRKGPWTVEEDTMLNNYITIHGEGRWNSLARCAGLKRTGKSCRLRWLNYLRPDVRRGNITLQEQLLILDLHSRWGNRWSKIAQYLPGRTDNEIKNYWRTRVQKQAKHLKCDVNSKQFKDTMRYLWIPRLVERIRAASESSTIRPTSSITPHHISNQTDITAAHDQVFPTGTENEIGFGQVDPNFRPELSRTSSDLSVTQVSPVSDLTDFYDLPGVNCSDKFQDGSVLHPEFMGSTFGLEFQAFEQTNDWAVGGGDSLENLLNNADDIWFLQQPFYDEAK